MKSLRIFAILYLISGFCIEGLEAQASQKMNYILLDGSTAPTGTLETRYGHQNSPGLYGLNGLPSPLTNLTGKTYSLFISSNSNYNLIIEPILYNGIPASLTGDSVSMAVSGNYSTFNGKWERLTGKPITNTSTLYNSPLKRTGSTTKSYSPLYRATANIFNFAVNSKYPSLSAPK